MSAMGEGTLPGRLNECPLEGASEKPGMTATGAKRNYGSDREQMIRLQILDQKKHERAHLAEVRAALL